MKKFLSIFLLAFCLNSVLVQALNFYPQNLESDSVYMVNCNSGTAVVEKNINKRRSPASLTKIMSFIVAYEHSQDRDKTKVTVQQEVLDKVDPESSGVVLRAGEEISITDLLKCMMISSSGYAANVLANHIGGSIENFVQMMNDKAAELGCENTHFENPDGIYNPKHYSTASDMLKISRYAMKNVEFLNTVSISECNIFGDERDPVITTNYMIDKKRGGKYYSPWVKGIKTGYVEDAGKCLISYAVKDDESYLIVDLGAPVKDSAGNKLTDNLAMIDSLNLYNWAFDNLKRIKLYDRYFPITEVNLASARGKDKLMLESSGDVGVILPSNIKKDDLSFDFEIPEVVQAPIKKGDKIGTAKIMLQNEQIGNFDLVSSEEVKKSYMVVVMDALGVVVNSKIFIFCLAVIVLAIIGYLCLIFRYNRKLRRKNKVTNILDFKKNKPL